MLSMRFLFMILYTPAACSLALVRPFYGLLALVGMYYFRPTIWGAPVWFRPILWITVCVGVGWLLRIKSFRFSGLMSLAVITLLMTLASAVIAAKDTDLAIGAVWTLTKVIIVGFLTLQLVDSVGKVTAFLWANVLGMLWSIKTILYLGLVGGGVGEDVRVDVGVGQGGGSNYLAMILVMTLPFFYTRLLSGKRWEVRFSMIAAPIYVLCVVLTGSRGGFLALFVTCLYVIMRSNRKVLGMSVMLVLAVIFTLALPQSQWDRLKKGFESGEKRDFSAQSRILLWKAAWTMFQESPLFGKGPDNFQRLSPRYAGFYAGNVVKKYEEGQAGRGFVTHSTWFQTIAEGGLTVSIPFFAMFVVAFLVLFKVRHLPIHDPTTRRTIYYQAISMEGLWVGFMAASTFGSHIKIDFLWWYMGLTSALGLVAQAELSKERKRLAEAGSSQPRTLARPVAAGPGS
jgi:O-antigen ligase